MNNSEKERIKHIISESYCFYFRIICIDVFVSSFMLPKAKIDTFIYVILLYILLLVIMFFVIVFLYGLGHELEKFLLNAEIEKLEKNGFEIALNENEKIVILKDQYYYSEFDGVNKKTKIIATIILALIGFIWLAI